MSQALLRYEWNTIPWRKLERKVFKLQKRIYQASSRGDVKLVHRLQRLLLKSWSAKCLATRKVTQDNRGKKTAGVDGQTALTPEQRLNLVSHLKLTQKPLPTRRVWIDKPGKAEQRPLGIPTITERAQQALVKLALEPEWEAKFEPNSYGFRPGRSCHDAVEAIYYAVRYQAKYVLDADIAHCFDEIDHSALLNKLKTFPQLRRTIRAWLKAGVLDGYQFQPTTSGTPQGGVLSPLLANVALHGLETDIKELAYREVRGQKLVFYKNLQIIRYCDDFVVLHQDLRVVQRCQELIETWLSQMGLKLKPSKTRIGHTLESYAGEPPGFNFLGFHIRQYRVGKHHCMRSPRSGKHLGHVTLIKPSKEAVLRHLHELKIRLRKLKHAPQSTVIWDLSPLIRGWAQYYQTAVSRKTFEALGHLLFLKLWRWAKQRHPHKSNVWVIRKYFRRNGLDNWRFMTPEGSFLIRHTDHPIQRHIKVQGCRSPFDGDQIYWSTRLGRHPMLPRRVAKLLKQQQGRCHHCRRYFRLEDILEVHHIDGNHQNNRASNLALLHGHCHDAVHGRGVYDKHRITEEPYESKGSCTVLEPSRVSDHPT